MMRSVLAVIAGIVVLTITSFAMEAAMNPLLMKMLALPNEAALNQSALVKWVTFGSTALCIAVGGYMTAWLAQRAKVMHAVIMGVVQAGLTTVLMFERPQLAPQWAWIMGIAMTVPMAFVGAALRVWRSASNASKAG